MPAHAAGATRASRSGCVLAIVVWNGIYDVLVARGVKEFLFRHALSEAGAGPVVPLAAVMHTTVVRATGVGILWAVSCSSSAS